MAAVDDVDGTEAPSTLTVDQLSINDGVLAVKVIGQLDVSTEGLLRDALQQALKDSATKIVVDASELDFMDSSGLAVLIVAAREVESVELQNPTTIVRRLVTIAGLTETLHLTPDA